VICGVFAGALDVDYRTGRAQNMIMARTSRGRVRHLHIVMSAEEIAMVQEFAGLLGLTMADAIRLAVRRALVNADRQACGRSESSGREQRGRRGASACRLGNEEYR
jgi:hypothetical protein